MAAVMAAITMQFNAHLKNGMEEVASYNYHTSNWIQQHITLGYSRMLSVLYWFDTINDFGGKHPDEVNYNHFADRLHTITTLNPYAKHAYYTAATVLTWELHSTTLSQPLLDRAMTTMPSMWQWPYYRGFYSYFFDHDTANALKFLSIASHKKKAPSFLINVAARMRAEQAGLKTALTFLYRLLEKKQDPTIKEKLEKQIKQIQTEQQLRKLDALIDTIPNWQGNIDQLKQYGIRIPSTLPDGGHVIFDQHHRPVSSAQKVRYRLFQSPTYLKRNP